MASGEKRRTALVLRRPGLEAAQEERYWKALDAVTYAPVAEALEKVPQHRKLLFEANAPLHDIIAKDAGALAALKKVSDFRKEMVKRAGAHVLSKPDKFSPFTSFELTPGLHAFAPPYDLARQGPNKGSPVVASSDRDKGEMFVNVLFDKESEGLRIATASVVVIFSPTVPGTIAVRPIVKFAHSWMVAGLHLSAHSEGWITTTAIRERDGRIEDRKAVLLWSRTTESDHHKESSEELSVYPPDLYLEFLADPAETYLVSISAIVSGDQSGDEPILVFPSWSYFTGCISASVPYLAAELRQ